MSKKPWICPACRSIETNRSAPAEVIRSATRRAVMGVRGATLRSWRAYPKYGTTAVIEAGDARRGAAVMISSSLKGAVARGGGVWTRKTARPRGVLAVLILVF